MILRSSIKEDIVKLKKYGKAKAILDLKEYLPNVNPFKEIILVDSYEDFIKVRDSISEEYFYRRDLPLGKEMGKRVSKDGKKDSLISFFKNMKKLNEEGVLLFLISKQKNEPRYKCNGAFNVAIEKNKSVILELVGKGFDGRDLSHGTVAHETYIIPWEDIIFCDSYIKLNQYLSHKINEHEYEDTRNIRIEFLKKINTSEEEIEDNLPKEYIKIKNHVKEDIINKIIFPLFVKLNEDYNLGNLSWVCGNITLNNDLMPFEFSGPERVNKKFLRY